MQIVSKNIFKKIILTMDMLDEESLSSSQNYIIKCLSAFDRWIDEKRP